MRLLHGSHDRRRRRVRILSHGLATGQGRRALVVIAHGSRNSLANDEVRALAAWLEDQQAAEIVRPAFLEIAEPPFAVAAFQLAGEGVTEVDVLPHFLNTGRHVSRDVPGLVAAAALVNPSIRFRILPHLGGAAGFSEAVLAIVRSVMNS